MSNYEAIQQLKYQAEQYQRQNKPQKYIESLEQLLELEKLEYGPNSEEVNKLVLYKFLTLQEKLCTVLNLNGIIQLQKLEFILSLEYLKKAELLSTTTQQKVITYNNIGCFYRKTGKIKLAQNYLQQALAIELMLPQSLTLSDTYLNLCAVLSQQNRHEEALQHIYLSIIMLQHELLSKTLGWVDLKNVALSSSSNYSKIFDGVSKSQSFSQEFSQEYDSANGDPTQMNKLQDRVAVLVVAYHNLGVEMKFLNKDLEATKIFNSALNLAEQNLNKNHQMVKVLKQLNQTKAPSNEQILKLNLPKVANRKQRQKKLELSTSPLAQSAQRFRYSVPLVKSNSNASKKQKNILFVPGINKPQIDESSGYSLQIPQKQQLVRLKSLSGSNHNYTSEQINKPHFMFEDSYINIP